LSKAANIKGLKNGLQGLEIILTLLENRLFVSEFVTTSCSHCFSDHFCGENLGSICNRICD